MDTTGRAARQPHELVRVTSTGRHRVRRRPSITGGGTDGNERLTASTGVLLIALLAVIGITILRIGQLIAVHLFVGLLLIGPVALKLASSGYRFARYYTGNRAYRRKGPPMLVLRAIAPAVVVSTVAVFATGIVLMLEGPAHRDPWLLLHKASFIVWIAFTALHVLGHLPGLGRSLRAGARPHGLSTVQGRAGRSIALVGALIGGLVLALVLIPDFGLWTHHTAALQDH